MLARIPGAGVRALLLSLAASLALAVPAGATQFDYVTSWTGGLNSFSGPTYDAVDPINGYVYVADTVHKRIERFDLSGAAAPFAAISGATSGNVLGVSGGNFKGGATTCADETPACFGTPLGIAVDGDGNFYVVDQSNWDVTKFDKTGLFQAQFGYPSGTEHSFDSGCGTTDCDSFAYPTAIAVNGDGLFVLDGSGNARVVQLSTAGAFIAQFGGTEGSGDEAFENAQGIAVEPAGAASTTFYVADTGNNRISKWSTATGHVLNWGSLSDPGAVNPPLGTFKAPVDIAYTPGDGGQTPASVLVTDSGNYRVEQFAPDGSSPSAFGSFGSAHGQFESPWGIAVNPDEATFGTTVFVVDNTLNTVQKFAPGQPPSVTTPPAVSGTAQQGQALTATDGAWTNNPTSYAHTWQRCDSNGLNCSPINNATAGNYTLIAADVGHTIKGCVVAHNSVGDSPQSCSVASAVVLPLPPSNTTPPQVTGTAAVGHQLTTTDGAWDNNPQAPFAYAWQRCDALGLNCEAINGATQSTYTLIADDASHVVEVVVTAHNDGGSTPATSNQTGLVVDEPTPTAQPTISGTAQAGAVLTASKGTWTYDSSNSYAYQWLACDGAGAQCAPIAGANATTYTLQPGDVGKTIRIAVTATNAAGPHEAQSAATAVVKVAAPAASAGPTISGTPAVGQTLTANNGTWSGSPTFAYQWLVCDGAGSNCSEVAGATASTYVVKASDQGHAIRVVVTATNPGGSTPATSSPVSVPAAPVATATPTAAPAPTASPTPAPGGGGTSPVTQVSATTVTPTAAPTTSTVFTQGVPVKLTTVSGAGVSAVLLLDKKTAKKVHIGNGKKSVVVGTARTVANSNGSVSLHLKVAAKYKKKLKKLKKYVLTMRITLTDATGHKFTISRKVTIKH